CDFMLVCANSMCVVPGMANASCDSTHPCAQPLVCKNAICSTPGAAGAPCSSSAQDCDRSQGLICNPMTNVCHMVTLANAGQPWGVMTTPTLALAVCTGGAQCSGQDVQPGTCIAPAADGAHCDESMHIGCVDPAKCVNGVCKISDPATCH